jgi:4-hydroxy-3-methylbut-2-en-1-yl diphosphate reductase
MKKFNVPVFFRSSYISQIKEARRINDPRKKDFEPSILDFGTFKIHMARHFGFCYGVENAIETAYKAIEENLDKRIFLLSEMIHNQAVNQDLLQKGVRYIMDNKGNQMIPWSEISNNDIVITPAFGTTVEIENILKDKGIVPEQYNSTCPFVERVWKASEKIGAANYTIIIHGKPMHEETRATFSHSKENSAAIIVRNIEEAKKIGAFMLGQMGIEEFNLYFKDRVSANFNATSSLNKVGVVNQTTMLASDTREIADYFKAIMQQKHGIENLKEHFADTRDTLCYATNDNQEATVGLLKIEADMAIVVGGYNSSNTSHLVDLCAQKVPTYFISSADEIIDQNEIHHFDYHRQEKKVTMNFMPQAAMPKIIITSGASCPDTLLDAVLDKIHGFLAQAKNKDLVLKEFLKANS